MESHQLIRFLLIEDDPDHAHLIRRSLKRSRVLNKVTHFSNGLDGLSYLREQATSPEGRLPDVLLLDLRLPGLSGHEVLEQVRNDEKLKHLQVVILTTSSDEADRQRAKELNANSYVLKPLDFQRFQAMISDLSLYWGVWNLND